MTNIKTLFFPDSSLHAALADVREQNFHSHVSHGILKEHQVERGVDLVVAVQHLQQGLAEAAPRFGGHVLGLPEPTGEVAVQVHLSGPLQSLLRILRGGQEERRA